jgi:murein DD-endopeptidase MepM/ murein hydrolase activator NlpD
MKLFSNLPRIPIPRWIWWVLAVLVLFVLARFLIAVLNPRNRTFYQWFSDPNARPEMVTLQAEPCPGAPFVLPAQGFIGLLYGDPRGPYSLVRPHQGIDIFGDGELGTLPVVAAYDGYLTREAEWVSALIIRHPEDPLDPSRQIWTYYTHMADRDGNTFIHEAFPPGTREVFVERGTLLGHMGNYSGNAGNPTGHHAHFSIDTNELEFSNTLDPSPYLGMTVNYNSNPSVPIGCDEVASR